jgi:TolA-binding protein
LLADCYFALADFNRAATLYEALSAPELPRGIRERAFEGRVQSLARAGNTKEATQEAERAAQSVPSDDTSGQAAYELGIRQLDEGHLAEGVASLREFLTRGEPASHVLEANRRCAEASVKLGDKVGAAGFYRAAAERAAPGEALGYRFDAGQLLYETGRYSEAQAEFAKVLLLNPDGTTRDYATYNIGLTQKETGEEAKALETLGKVAMNPSADRALRSDALLEAGLLARKLEKPDEARRYLCEVASIGTGATAAEGLYWCAECDFDAEHYDEAILGFGRLITQFPGEVEWVASARYRTAEAFEKLNRWREAQAEYERIVAGTSDETWAADARRRLEWIKENSWVLDEPPIERSSQR